MKDEELLEYRKKQIRNDIELAEQWGDPNIDNDIINLKMIENSIGPYSRWWRYGFKKSLKRAIRLMEKERAK